MLDLMVRIATGDRAALATLYQQTSNSLFGTCLRICREKAMAEDVLQNVYIKIWSGAGQYRISNSYPLGWLQMIARNAAIDAVRKARRDRQTIDIESLEIADGGDLADAQIESGEDIAKIHSCIEQLDESQRAPIKAAFFGGVTYSILADRDAVPLSTMKSRIRRGLAQLKNCLDDE